MNTRTIMQSAAAALALTVAAVPAPAHNGGRPYAPPSRLEGAWVVTITPYVCSTGVSLPAAAFKSYMTFGARGTISETTSNASFQAGQRSPGHGFWEMSGKNQFHAVIQAFVQFTSAVPVTDPPTLPRYVRGVHRIEQGIELVDADHWTSDAVVTFTDMAGNPITPVIATAPPVGCAQASAERLD